MVEIIKISPTSSLIARQDGILISGIADGSTFRPFAVSDPALQALVRRLPSLLSDGTFETTPEGIYASIESLANLEGQSHDPLDSLFEWSPYTLKIHGSGTLGVSDFKLIPRFYLGKRVVPLRHVGIFAWRSKSIVRLLARQAAAIQVCDAFGNFQERCRIFFHDA